MPDEAQTTDAARADGKLSVILPVFNEEDNLTEMNSQLCGVLSALNRAAEIIYVDDGSRDSSPQMLADIAQKNTVPTSAILFRRNFGQTAAIAAGVDAAEGDIIILMDSDLQNDPADIPAMVARLDQGYDVVSGWRKDRKDSFIRRLPSQVANRLISASTGVHLHDYGCTLKAYRADVIQRVRLYGEMHRFIPIYADAYGAQITEMVVNHRPRVAGKSKYGLWRTFKVILDLITVKFLSDYGTRPMYIFGGIGLLFLLASFGVLFLAIFYALISGTSLIQTPLPTLAAVLGAVGVQSVLLGLTTEMLVRTYHESQSKPIYTIRRTIKRTESASPQPDNTETVSD